MSERFKAQKVHLVSLGCARNLVDSELMLGRLCRAGWETVHTAPEADVIIVNTCSFIESAVAESVDAVLQYAQCKETGCCRRLIVCGCLPQRYRGELAAELPEVDCFLGTGAFDRIVPAAAGALPPGACVAPPPDRQPLQTAGAPRVVSSPFSVYLKIAEGCSRACTYCIIPVLRGRQRSRTRADLRAEAAQLIADGAKELVLVAQDSTAYGRDLTPPADLAELLADLAGIDANVWIRFLYGHPLSLQSGVIRAVAAFSNVCSYFDLPIQHASDDVLRRMGRGYDRSRLMRLVDTIRHTVPHAALRTTIMVGFPGESDRDFDDLVAFIKAVRFDHLGVFVYSDARDLASHRLKGRVPKQLAEERCDRIMALQAEISAGNNERHIGREYSVLVESRNDAEQFVGRTCFQAPEVDGVTLVIAQDLVPGRFVRVKITHADEYDLIGEAL